MIVTLPEILQVLGLLIGLAMAGLGSLSLFVVASGAEVARAERNGCAAVIVGLVLAGLCIWGLRS